MNNKKIIFILKEIFKIAILVYLGLGIVLYVFQNKYIYHPDKTDFQNCSSFNDSEKISFNLTRAYLIKQSPDKLIVFYHGNAGRACDRDYLIKTFTEKGYSVLFIEYTGYGEDKNKPSMSRLLKNTIDTVEFLKTQNFKKITVIGESIGVGLASYHSMHSNIDNLILITAYNNFADVTFSHYPVYPTSLLLRNNFKPDKWLSGYNGKVSVILAENDEIIPNKLGQKLYDQIPSNLKKLYIIKSAGHNTIYEKEEFYHTLKLVLE